MSKIKIKRRMELILEMNNFFIRVHHCSEQIKGQSSQNVVAVPGPRHSRARLISLSEWRCIARQLIALVRRRGSRRSPLSQSQYTSWIRSVRSVRSVRGIIWRVHASAIDRPWKGARNDSGTNKVLYSLL